MHHPASYHDALPGIPVAFPLQTLPASQPSGSDLQHWPSRIPPWAWGNWFPFSAALEQWPKLPLFYSSAWLHLSHLMLASIIWGGHHENYHRRQQSVLSWSSASLWRNQATISPKKCFWFNFSSRYEINSFHTMEFLQAQRRFGGLDIHLRRF